MGSDDGDKTLIVRNHPITVVHGIPDAMRASAVELYDEAFGAKFAVALPSARQRRAVLSASLDLTFAFAALAGPQLVGVAGYKTSAGSFTGGLTYRQLLRHTGPLQGTWAAVVFSLYERRLSAGQLLMDGIVVDASKRGEGIGTCLLNHVTAYAAANDYRHVRLDVIDTNPSAQRLYERNGFVPRATEHFGYLRWLLGFGACTTLIRAV
ncbi:MAG: GNAT family N-acetyltransferase [Planctomycetota bacterium]